MDVIVAARLAVESSSAKGEVISAGLIMRFSCEVEL